MKNPNVFVVFLLLIFLDALLENSSSQSANITFFLRTLLHVPTTSISFVKLNIVTYKLDGKLLFIFLIKYYGTEELICQNKLQENKN